ncbi:hypothetical protein [Jannaschia aquimarina]|uniref:DUF4399 domain-containing protein n=1 Tax=Jannaschia aquimarina TaxID=935700 RepID=A0A0D1EJM8_9RHOB|nr:hypothetical protein [Jannaschia aquimarina]KIT17191.1 hypothetical protein jaqu_09220 [Jannaschia aquimarina]SNT18140.1 hypothetical protein SAMN05421775_10748 [Jannaschia aquimarina]
MMRRILSRPFAPVLALAGLLTSLAVAAPIYNAGGGAPRAVFLELPARLPEPEVALRADPLPSGRWRLTLAARHFRFTDICVLEAEAVPLGHAHIVHDGVKLAAAYAPIVDIGPLPPGRHRIEAVLRAQDHRAILGRGGLIKGAVVIEVPERAGGV